MCLCAAVDVLAKLAKEGEAAGICLEQDYVGADLASCLTRSNRWLERCSRVLSELKVHQAPSDAQMSGRCGLSMAKIHCTVAHHCMHLPGTADKTTCCV